MTTSKPNKSDYIRFRIHPDKKAALEAVALREQLDTSKLLMAQIEKLIHSDSISHHAVGTETPDDEAPPDLSGRLSFRPLPGDERQLHRYAADRNLKPSEVMKLILRGWISKNPPLPKDELAQLAITSNQLAALGRNLNQLVKLAHTGNAPLPGELVVLLDEILQLTHQASLDIDALVKINLHSWESDHA